MNGCITLWRRAKQAEEERSKGHAGLQVSLQETKGFFDYASLPIRASTASAQGSWRPLTALPAHPHTPEPLGDYCLPARHRAAMASPTYA